MTRLIILSACLCGLAFFVAYAPAATTGASSNATAATGLKTASAPSAVQSEAVNDAAPVALKSSLVSLPADIDDAALAAWREKRSFYIKALNSKLQVDKAIEDYLRWAKKNGPKSGQKEAGLIYDVSGDLEDIIQNADENANFDLRLDIMDAPLRELASASAILGPLLKEGSAYYDSKAYLNDNMAEGIALHNKILPAYSSFSKAGNALASLEPSLSDELDKVNLALIEKNEGRKYHWHHINMVYKARQVMDAIPRTRKDKKELEVYIAAVNEFEAAQKNFDAYCKKAGEAGLNKERSSGFRAGDFDYFLQKARQLGKEFPDNSKSGGTVNKTATSLIDNYNGLIIHTSNSTIFK